MPQDVTNLDDLPFFEPQMRSDPYWIYRRLREVDPVHWSEKHQAWMVTGYDAVLAGLENLKLSSNRVDALEAAAKNDEFKPLFEFLRDRLVLVDPPRHGRIRGIVAKAFTPNRIEALRPMVQGVVNGFLDAVQPAGRMDLIRDLAFPLPATVITTMLGVPTADKERLKELSDAFTVYFSNHPSKITAEQFRSAQAAMRELSDYFRAALERVRNEPADCLLKLLEVAEHEGQKLSEREALSNASLLLVAGHETTTSLLGNGMLELLRDTGQWELLRSNPDLIPNAVEEFLRFGGPVQFTHRTATEDVPLGGKTVRKGQFVFLFLAAANRDPAHFSDPDRFDVTRKIGRHVAFGMGHHFCLGAPLARLELQIAVATILKRFPRMKMEEQDLEYNENFNLHGLKRLTVRLGE